MGLNLNKVHDYERIAGTQEVRLIGVDPYLRLCMKDKPPLFIQGGKVFSEGDQLIPDEDLPDWFWDQVSKTTLEVLEEVGFSTAKAGEEVEVRPATSWVCDECKEEVSLESKVQHIISHRRNPPEEKADSGNGKAKKG